MSAPRRTGVTSVATLASFAGAFVFVHAFAPQWAKSAGLDVWHLPEAVQHRDYESVRERAIDIQFDGLAQQISASDATANALLEGRIDFARAVDQIEEINRDRGGFAAALQAQYPEGTHREQLEQYLIAKVCSKVVKDPSRRAEVLARLPSAKLE